MNKDYVSNEKKIVKRQVLVLGYLGAFFLKIGNE